MLTIRPQGALVGALSVILLAGCSIQTPQVTFTSERTSLETQILGSYRALEAGSWEVASNRAPDEAGAPLSDLRWAAMEAFARRSGMLPELRQLCQGETIGENASGYLSLRPEPKYNDDSTYRARVDSLIRVENQEREIILRYLFDVQGPKTSTEKNGILSIFARINQEAAPLGTWIQLSDSSWVKK